MIDLRVDALVERHQRDIKMTTAAQYEMLTSRVLKTWIAKGTENIETLSAELRAICADREATGTVVGHNLYLFQDGSIFDANTDRAIVASPASAN